MPGDTDLKKPGLRIEKQARKVRDQLDLASECAQLARAEAGDDASELECDERSEVERLRLEPYIGFYELHSAAGAAPAPVRALAAASPAASPAPRAELPRWLEKRLGPDGVRALREYVGDEYMSGYEWPSSEADADSELCVLTSVVASLARQTASHLKFNNSCLADSERRAETAEAEAAALRQQLCAQQKQAGKGFKKAMERAEKRSGELVGKLEVAREHIKRLRGREHGMRDAFAFALHTHAHMRSPQTSERVVKATEHLHVMGHI